MPFFLLVTITISMPTMVWWIIYEKCATSVERKAKIKYITRLRYTFIVNLETVVPAFESKEDCVVDQARIRVAKQCLPTCAPRIHFRSRGLFLWRSLESFIKKKKKRNMYISVTWVELWILHCTRYHNTGRKWVLKMCIPSRVEFV